MSTLGDIATPCTDSRIDAALDIHEAKDFLRPSGRIVQLCKVCNVTFPCKTRRVLKGETL